MKTIKSHHELVAFCSSQILKRALLLCDRVHLWDTPKSHQLPDGGSEFELFISSINVSTFPDHFIPYMRLKADSLKREGSQLIPIFDNDSFLVNYIPKGNEIGYSAALHNLPLVVEDIMPWDQIFEFRKDKETLQKYRRLRLWLSDSLNAESTSEAEDKIALMINDYQWAIKKHGLQTRIGLLKQLTTSSNLQKIIVGGGVSAILISPIFAALFSGVMIGAEITAYIAERKVESADIERGENSEIALLYDISKRVEKLEKSPVEKLKRRIHRT